MSEQDVEQLREANIRLESALEQALLFIEEIAAGGVHEQFEAQALASVLQDSLKGGNDQP